MTTIEVAGIGLIVAALLVAALRRFNIVFRVPVIIAALTVVYFACTDEWDHRQWFVLLLAIGWAAHHVYWVRKDLRLTSQAGNVLPWKGGVARETAMTFLASAPILVAVTEAESIWSWADAFGLLIFAIGLYVSLFGAKRVRHQHLFGEMVIAWSFYVFALAVPNGFLTIFAPLLVVEPLKRAFSVEG